MDETVKYIIEQSDSDEEKTLSELVTSTSTFTQLGQYYGVLKAETNLLDLLNTKFENMSPEGVTYSAIDLIWFRIEFNSAPYLIYDDGTNIKKVTSNDYDNLIYGWIVYINNQPIIIKSDFNYYEITDEDSINVEEDLSYFEIDSDEIFITSVTVPEDTEVTIDYICRIGQTDGNKDDIIYSKIIYYDTIGQLWGTFEAGESLVERIKQKYIVKSDSHVREISTIYGVSIEADAGTVVYVQDSFDDTAYKHVIGETGVLKLENEKATIEELYFLGTEDSNTASVDALVDYYCEVMEGDF